MTQKELSDALKSTGLPVRYHSFKSPPNPPYILYLFSYSSDLMADDYNYLDISNFQVELYNTKKDPPTEKLVESKLKEIGLPYSKLETFIKSEGLYQILYRVQLIGG